MAPLLLTAFPGPPEPEFLEQVVTHLRGGGLVAMPTETVYGLGCIPEEKPLRKVQRLKGRGPDKPFLLLIPHVEAAPGLEWGAHARKLAKVFWPGALTLVLRDPERSFPLGVRSPGGGVAVRVSPHPLASAVVAALQAPVVSTSANASGGPPALTAQGVLETARGWKMEDDLWILDGGPLEPSDPSTVVDCTGPSPTLRRLGAIPLNRLRRVLPEIHGPA